MSPLPTPTRPLRWRRQAGQAMVEYVSLTSILLLGALGFGMGWPYTQKLLQALQGYVDLFFYALNLPVG